ncbi:ABC transporter G family member 35 [Hibiscus syriacus]|uniref:ABC transporter G family member 35 n=1 Tax=Hibiscus syriacus TaxID=106335 RepID=A0A6A2Z9A0_HIBSY|nr:ABC transporter G family member 35 [Hibiscus syriacus]
MMDGTLTIHLLLGNNPFVGIGGQVGSKLKDLLSELARREKYAGIFPEADVDLFMKATAMGVESSLFTDYTLKVTFGFRHSKDTIAGDEMQRGISGGEMIVGPTKTLFMDEISTGLDSSTTYQIVKCLQKIVVVHLTEATILMSLLQPAPETFDLFDDIILLSEGQIVYQGLREHVVEFFESCGFKCPERKGTADFLQEVNSKKNQERYRADRSKPYRYITVTEFANRFRHFHVGVRLENEIYVPFDKSRGHRAALAFKKILVFLRTELHTRNEQDAAIYVDALLFGMIINMFNGFSKLSTMISRLLVLYKQRDLLFHPVWTFTLPTFLLRVPISILESTVWMIVTYYTTGFAPEASRTMIIANTGGALTLLVFLLGGFIIPKGEISNWWEWAYWVSPLTYGYNAFTVNELFAPRLRTTLRAWDKNWYWIGAAALLGFAMLFNILFTFALMYLNPLGKPQAVISKETAKELEANNEGSKGEPRLRRPKSSKDSFSRSLSSVDANNSREMEIKRLSSRTNPNGMSRNDSSVDAASGVAPKRGMVLPFTPLAMSFDTVNYYVDMPPEMKAQGVAEDRKDNIDGCSSGKKDRWIYRG